jgi:putative ABC transport system permease protein
VAFVGAYPPFVDRRRRSINQRVERLQTLSYNQPVMIRYVPLILKNTLRNKRRSILTVLSVAASLTLLGVLMAMYYAFYFSEASPQQALRLITRNRVSLATPIPVSYAQKIRNVPGVREVGITQWFGGTYKDSDFKNFFARFAVEPTKLFLTNPEYRVAEDQKQAFLRDRAGALVGRPLAERYGWKIGDRVTIMGDIYPVNLEFTIRAFYDAPRDNENFLFHYEYLRESVSPGRRDAVCCLVILADSPDSVPRIAQTVDAMFRNDTAQTKTESERAFELGFLSYLGNVKLFLLSVCAAVTFTLLLVSGNTMAMSVRERVREVGIMKTLGFTPVAILAIIVGEAVAIALIGGALGLAFSELICSYIRQGPITFVDLKALHVPPVVMLGGLLLAAVVGMASALVPALGASRKSIVECLRFAD